MSLKLMLLKNKPISFVGKWHLILSASLLFFTLCSCQKSEPINPSPSLPNVGDSVVVVNYLALGDSYTIGESVVETERYPNQLAIALDSGRITVNPPQIIARTGWTTSQLIEAMDTANLQDRYDLVSLLIGVNNQFRGLDLDLYEEEFLLLLDRAIALADGDPGRVVVLSIPDYAFTPFGQNWADPNVTSQEIDQYNALNLAMTESRGIAYFNITPISRRGLDEPDLVANDGLHPSGKMYQLWVEQIKDTVRSLLEP